MLCTVGHQDYLQQRESQKEISAEGQRYTSYSPEMRGKPAHEFKEATLKFMELQKARDEAISRLDKHRKRKARKGKKP